MALGIERHDSQDVRKCVQETDGIGHRLVGRAASTSSVSEVAAARATIAAARVSTDQAPGEAPDHRDQHGRLRGQTLSPKERPTAIRQMQERVERRRAPRCDQGPQPQKPNLIVEIHESPRASHPAGQCRVTRLGRSAPRPTRMTRGSPSQSAVRIAASRSPGIVELKTNRLGPQPRVSDDWSSLRSKSLPAPARSVRAARACCVGRTTAHR